MKLQPKPVAEPQHTGTVVLKEQLHGFGGASKTVETKQHSKRKHTIPQARRTPIPRHRKPKLRLHRKVSRTVAPVEQAGKPVELQTKPQLVLEPQPDQAVLISQRHDRVTAAKELSEPEQKPALRAKRATIPSRHKQEKLRLHRRAQSSATSVGQASKPVVVPAKPQLIKVQQFIETALGNKPLHRMPAHKQPAEKVQDSTLRARSTVIFGQRTIKISNLRRKARSTAIPVQVNKPVVFAEKRRVVSNPQSETVAINKRLDRTASQTGPAEEGRDSALRASSAVIPGRRRKKLRLRRKATRTATPVGRAKQPADSNPKSQAVSCPQPDKADVDQEQVPKTETNNEAAENGQGATTQVATTADAAAQGEKVIIDEASKDMPAPDAEASTSLAQDIPTKETEAIEDRLEPAADLECRAEEIAERGLEEANGVVPNGEAGEPANLESRPRKKVLVIDDDATMRMLLKMGLTSHDYECLTAENGKAAQEVLQANRPDLILLDLLMPVMDGLTFIQWLRQTARDSTPVLVFTNVDTPKITQEALAKGANSFACKPLHLKKLLEAMNQLVPD